MASGYSHDRRILQVELSALGRSMLAQARARETEWLIVLLNGSEERQMRTVAHVLRVIRQRLQRDERELRDRRLRSDAGLRERAKRLRD